MTLIKTLSLWRASVVAFVAVILLLSPTHAATRPDVGQETALLSIAKAINDKDDLSGIDDLEVMAMKAAGAQAVRQEDRLTLYLSSGATKVYNDRPECNDHGQESKCQKFRLIVHARSRGTFLVIKLYWESAEYLLVDDVSGHETVLRAFPIFSPSGEYVLVLLMNDEQVGFAVQVWRREGQKFVLDWRGAPHAGGMYTSYTLVRWPSETAIELKSETESEQSMERATRRFSLRYTARGWRFVE